jgi:hypothetical protein
MSYEAWGEPDDPPELPEGWWDEDQVAEAEARISALCSALKELVALKEMKDRGLSYDDRIEYADRKPKAWAAAKALLTPKTE